MLAIKNVILVIFSLIPYIHGLFRIDPLVETKVGLIRGLTSNDGYSMFMGIPFAKVDEANPFSDAIPFPVFENTFVAFDDSAMCPQVNPFNKTIVGNLDCLHLNIYVPSTASSKNRLPVMIWFYGGSFREGFSGRYLYGPKYLVRHDVILVTVNYRLGPYGFMCLDIPEASGNQGLKDQYIALQWVSQNIEAFGGNSKQITIFGESAGGHSVDLHLLSPKEKLYSKAILQSGSALARTVLIKPDKDAPLKLAAKLGFNTKNLTDALNFLAKAHTDIVIGAVNALNIAFKPCVEKEFYGTDSFITKSWIGAKVPKVAKMPILLGFNKDELYVNYENQNAEYFKELNVFPSHLKQIFNFNEDELKTMHDIVRHFYVGDEPLSENLKVDIGNFDSDFTYIHPIQRTINKYIESGAGDIFYYMFAYEGVRNFYKKLSNVTNAKGAVHADELGYLFDIQYINSKPSSQDQIIIDRMTTMWTNFAKYSDPTPHTSELLPVKWIPITNDSLNYLKIDTNLTLGNRPFKERMAFWDLFYKLNEKFLNNFK